MSRHDKRAKSVNQRVANRARERNLARADGFVAYAMDRLLYRLGRSSQAKEFYLKGGVLIANLLDAPHRFTRDIDLLRRRGPPDPDDLRRRFREIVALRMEDGVLFEADGVRAVTATRDQDGYDGIKVLIRASIDRHQVELRVDIGFGDALVPPARSTRLKPFLEDDEPARVRAYEAGPVVAEKIETLLSKFPAIRHRLKDLLDVVMISRALDFDGPALCTSLSATLKRRGTPIDVQVLDDMHEVLVGREWQRDWATMLREKTATDAPELSESITLLDGFVRPVLEALQRGDSPGRWTPGGPWRRDETK
jgi:hypothetical protein